MSNSTVTTLAKILKELYVGQPVNNLEYKKHKFLEMVPKKTNFVGKNMPVPIQYSSPQGASAAFSTAQAQIVASKFDAFALTRKKDYSLVRIENEAIRASASDTGSFIRGLKAEIDGAFRTSTRSIARSLYGDGGGSRGRINSTVTGTTVTLTDKRDIVNFEVGMALDFCSSSTGGTIRTITSPSTFIIATINRSAGSFTVPDMSAVASLTANDYIFRRGDYDAVCSGLNGWLPDTVSATAWYGVTRTTDATRLGGYRYDASSVGLESGLRRACAELAGEGGQPDAIFMNHIQVDNLVESLGNRVRYDKHNNADMGFTALTIMTPAGPIPVYGDQDCPYNKAYILQMDTWCLWSLGECPGLLNSDGNDFLRVTDEDAVEVRIGAYLNLACNAPGWNCVVTLPT